MIAWRRLQLTSALPRPCRLHALAHRARDCRRQHELVRLPCCVQIMDSVPKMTGIITPKSVYYEEGKTLRKD
jgi:hypothetical protein